MKQNSKFYNIMLFIVKPFVKIFFPYEVKGLENIKQDQNYIICCNHLSNIDPVFLMLTHAKCIYFMAKQELFKNKFLGAIFSKMGAFAVKRGQGDKSALKTAEQILNDNKILGIFIEGTRSKTGEFLRPKSGVAFLANNTQSDILPVCITGGGKNNKVKMFKKTTIQYGPIIKYSAIKFDSGVRQELKNSTNLIMENIKKLREN